MLIPITKAAAELDMDEEELLILLKNLPGRNFTIKRGKIMVDLQHIIELFEEHSIPILDNVRSNPRRGRKTDDEDAEDDEDDEDEE